jgi:hypothetical protein
MCDEHPSWLRHSFALPLLVVAFAGSAIFTGMRCPAAAGQAVGVAWTNFDIPAEPLASALTAYGVRTRVALFVDMNLIAGRRSVALRGVFSAEAGLQSLLVGTGLVALPVGDGFALVRAQAERASANDENSSYSAAAASFLSYSALLQGSLKHALCAHEETRPGNYRALLRLWINGAGSVAEVRLLTSTGDPKRDGLLYSALRGLDLGARPPESLPQPVTLLLAPGRQNTAIYCSETAARRIDFDASSERPR